MARCSDEDATEETDCTSEEFWTGQMPKTEE